PAPSAPGPRPPPTLRPTAATPTAGPPSPPPEDSTRTSSATCSVVGARGRPGKARTARTAEPLSERSGPLDGRAGPAILPFPNNLPALSWHHAQEASEWASPRT